jgi:hypothetical protein
LQRPEKITNKVFFDIEIRIDRKEAVMDLLATRFPRPSITFRALAPAKRELARLASPSTTNSSSTASLQHDQGYSD